MLSEVETLSVIALSRSLSVVETNERELHSTKIFQADFPLMQPLFQRGVLIPLSQRDKPDVFRS